MTSSPFNPHYAASGVIDSLSDRIASLERERAELREALRLWLDCTSTDGNAFVLGGRIADYRAAHATASALLAREVRP